MEVPAGLLCVKPSLAVIAKGYCDDVPPLTLAVLLSSRCFIALLHRTFFSGRGKECLLKGCCRPVHPIDSCWYQVMGLVESRPEEVEGRSKSREELIDEARFFDRTARVEC